jgi:hypothetical protein
VQRIEKRLFVNPINIPVTPSANRIEYVMYKSGIKNIYVIELDPNLPPQEASGTVAHHVYQPKGEIKFDKRENISNNDVQIKNISQLLARDYGLRYEYVASRFYNVGYPIKHELWDYKTLIGYIEIYDCIPKLKPKFGPMIEVSVPSKNRTPFDEFIRDLKIKLRRFYPEPQIFQVREKHFSIFGSL